MLCLSHAAAGQRSFLHILPGLPMMSNHTLIAYTEIIYFKTPKSPCIFNSQYICSEAYCWPERQMDGNFKNLKSILEL